MGTVLMILGALLVLEGIPYFAFPAKAKEWAASVQEVSSRALRVVGLISVSAGLIILYLVRFF